MEFLIDIEVRRVTAEADFVSLFLNIYILYYDLFYSEILFFFFYIIFCWYFKNPRTLKQKTLDHHL